MSIDEVSLAQVHSILLAAPLFIQTEDGSIEGLLNHLLPPDFTFAQAIILALPNNTTVSYPAKTIPHHIFSSSQLLLLPQHTFKPTNPIQTK